MAAQARQLVRTVARGIFAMAGASSKRAAGGSLMDKVAKLHAAQSAQYSPGFLL